MREDAFLLTTRRLVLRQVTAADASALYALYGDWEVARWLSRLPWPFTRAAARTMVAEADAALRRGSGYFLAMLERDTGACVGVVSLRIPAREPQPWTDDAGLGILGYAVAHDSWGQGFAGEAAACLTAFAFTELGLARLRATPLRGNTASRRILERLGFTVAEVGVEETPRYGGPPRIGDVYLLEPRLLGWNAPSTSALVDGD